MNSKKINQLATELTPSLSDITIIGDPSTGISKKITLSQMASLFTGTVEEYANLAAFPLVGVADTIYIALDTNVLYRWDTGLTSYVELSPNIINSLVFSDANGFDGTISLVGSVATLTITTALTTGSVAFIGVSGALLQDNANFFWDDTNNRLGINTNAPTTALDVFGSGIIGRVNGTSTNNAFLGFASAGSNKWSIGNVQSDHRFRIYNEATTSELVSVLQTGEFGIGIANPTTKLHIDGGASALIANLDANISVAKSISFRSDNSARINLEVSGTESGSNAGANLFINRYSDAGALINTALYLIRSTGTIAIGGTTITDSNMLNIIGDQSSVNIGLVLNNTNSTYARIYALQNVNNNLNIRDYTASSDRLTLTSTGNIGIATASPNIGGYGSNSRVLTIQGVSGSYGILELTSNSANADGNAIGRLDFGSDGQAAGYKAISSIASFLSGSTSTKFGADLRFYTRVNNAASGDPAERMRIMASGNIGINSTNPEARLEVRGSGNTAINSKGQLFVASGGTATQTAEHGGQISFGAWLNGDLSAPYPVAAIKGVSESSSTDVNKGALIFSTMNNTTNAERARITSLGNFFLTAGVSTGVTDTRFLLIAQGTTSSTYAMVLKQSNNSTNLFLVRDDGLIQTGTASGSPYNNTSGAAANLVVNSAGTLERATSSLKYKTDVVNYDKGLAEVLKMRPVYYKSINEREKDLKFAGLIAEEIEELGLTEFVQYAEDGTPDALAYSNMVSLLTKAIQEQQVQIAELKALINK